METELITTDVATPVSILPAEQPEDAARVLILGGMEANAPAFRASEALRDQMKAQDLRISALHQSGTAAVAWLAEAGIDLIALAGLQDETNAPLPEPMQSIGAGETEAMANRPKILDIKGIRLGIVSFAEQPTGEFNSRADILSLMAYDRVRMLLNQCDHVIVLLKSGLDAELPLPEWRAHYHHFVDAGASIVLDTGAARGWETYKTGVVFYGLGSPACADSLGLFLTLHRNGRLTYEARALQSVSGTIDFSKNDAFRKTIDAQNTLFTEERAYLAAANEMCLRLYCESESAQKRGVLGLFSPHAEEEQKLVSLLENESLRLMTLRAIRLKHAGEKQKRENAKKA
jgi:hypothetical protein